MMDFFIALPPFFILPYSYWPIAGLQRCRLLVANRTRDEPKLTG
jgi:hypothetical protein